MGNHLILSAQLSMTCLISIRKQQQLTNGSDKIQYSYLKQIIIPLTTVLNLEITLWVSTDKTSHHHSALQSYSLKDYIKALL